MLEVVRVLNVRERSHPNDVGYHPRYEAVDVFEIPAVRLVAGGLVVPAVFSLKVFETGAVKWGR